MFQPISEMERVDFKLRINDEVEYLSRVGRGVIFSTVLLVFVLMVGTAVSLGLVKKAFFLMAAGLAIIWISQFLLIGALRLRSLLQLMTALSKRLS